MAVTALLQAGFDLITPSEFTGICILHIVSFEADHYCRYIEKGTDLKRHCQMEIAVQFFCLSEGLLGGSLLSKPIILLMNVVNVLVWNLTAGCVFGNESFTIINWYYYNALYKCQQNHYLKATRLDFRDQSRSRCCLATCPTTGELYQDVRVS